MSGPVRAPQKFLLSQQFRYLMRCKKYLKKIFLSCLVSEIQLFVYIFGWISKWPPEVRKGSLVKFFEVSYYQNFFSSLPFIKVKIDGAWKCLMIFLFTYAFLALNQQTADLGIVKIFSPWKFIYTFFVCLALMNNLTNFQPNSFLAFGDIEENVFVVPR